MKIYLRGGPDDGRVVEVPGPPVRWYVTEATETIPSGSDPSLELATRLRIGAYQRAGYLTVWHVPTAAEVFEWKGWDAQ